MVRIGISGSYGGANLGDEAILRSIVTGLRGALPDAQITVFSLDPADTVRRHGVRHAILTTGLSRGELLDEVRKLDLLILGGGGILFDHWVKEHLREALLAEEAGVRVMVCAVGAGPLVERANIDAVQRCVTDAEIVTVRDVRARRTLERLGITREILVTADPALLLEPEELPTDTFVREDITGNQPLIGMSVREPGPAAPDIDVEHYHIQLASAADYMVDRFNARIVFVPMEPERYDVQQSHAVISNMYRARNASVLGPGYTSGQVLNLIGHFAFVVGMRLHFLLFAAMRGVPFVALPYAPKVMGFIEELGMETPPVEGLTIGRLLAYVDRMWDRQDDLRRLMAEGVPMLQERARQTLALAVDLAKRCEPTAEGGAEDDELAKTGERADALAARSRG